MENNFTCTKCDHEFHLTSYSFSIKGYTKKDKKPIKCPKCESTSIAFINKPGGGFCTTFGKFASSSPIEKQKILQKRARAHGKKYHNPNDVKSGRI